jgi:AcrR family transcriptional regulator
MSNPDRAADASSADPAGPASAGQEQRRGRGRPRDPETDTRIIQAASDLMLRRGFDRMTVDDVASAAGVGKATVYRRWPSKEDLAVAAMEALYTDEIPEPDTGSIVGDLRATFRSVLMFANSPAGLAYLLTAITEAVRDERIAAIYREAIERAEAKARRMYERAIARGEIRADIDLDYCVQWLGGMLASRRITNRPMPRVDEADSLVDMVLRGILVEGDSPVARDAPVDRD